MSGSEYASSFLASCLLKAENENDLPILHLKFRKTIHAAFPRKSDARSPAAPHLKTAMNKTLKIIVTVADIKLPAAYAILSPKPLAICKSKDKNIFATTLVARKNL